VSGLVLWEGRSRHDGAPLVAIATGLGSSSTNRKTGAMVQVWILRSDIPPMDAVRSGLDSSVCGDCPQRWASGGACYVLVFQGPGSVYRAYQRGVYPRWDGDRAIWHGRAVRWGAYGDPALIPARIVRSISTAARRWTGYTHQWQDGRFAWAKAWFMASCDAEEEAALARSRGWRYFLATAAGSTPDGSVVCPASDEAGRRTTCADCGLCNGTRKGDSRRSVSIRVHGARAKRAS